MNARLVIAALLVVATTAGVVYLRTVGSGPAVDPQAGALIDLSSSASCQECHAEVYAEWESSYHAQSFLDPLVRAEGQSDNFRKEDCVPCHAPAPLLEYEEIGKGSRVYDRFSFREEGVDCLACHRMGHQVAALATQEASAAPCQPVKNAILPTATLCAPCHNQHETVDQWETTHYHREGVGCNDCHMPQVERHLADGTTRTGRSHLFLGGHDLPTLQSAIEVRSEVLDAVPALPEGVTGDALVPVSLGAGERVLRVGVKNTAAGHNYPTDARHRALDLVVTLVQHDGVEVPAREGRPAGREPGTARRRFRNPYRQEVEQFVNEEQYGRRNTQIEAGETLHLDVPFDPVHVGSAKVRLIFKLTPLQTDAEGVVVKEETVELAAKETR